MRPLHVNEINKFLSRFEKFVDAQIREVTIKSPTVIELKCSVQDSALEFDWIDLCFELSNVSDARVVENSKLSYLDMNEGLSIIYEDNKFALCYGNYNSLENAKDSTFYIICQSIKYEELPFSR